jgi:hypothetical protein
VSCSSCTAAGVFLGPQVHRAQRVALARRRWTSASIPVGARRRLAQHRFGLGQRIGRALAVGLGRRPGLGQPGAIGGDRLGRAFGLDQRRAGFFGLGRQFGDPRRRRPGPVTPDTGFAGNLGLAGGARRMGAFRRTRFGPCRQHRGAGLRNGVALRRHLPARRFGIGKPGLRLPRLFQPGPRRRAGLFGPFRRIPRRGAPAVGPMCGRFGLGPGAQGAGSLGLTARLARLPGHG